MTANRFGNIIIISDLVERAVKEMLRKYNMTASSAEARIKKHKKKPKGLRRGDVAEPPHVTDNAAGLC
jgi:hypothetical protein